MLPPPKPGGRPIKYHRREIVNAILYIAATPESGKVAPWFLELGDTLYDRCWAPRRALNGAGIIIAALAGMYLGRYAGIYYPEISGAAVFGLGGMAWAVATGYMVAVLVRGAALWRSGRMQ